MNSQSSDRALEVLNMSDFFEGSPIATFVVNADHIVTHFNSACATLLGVRASQVIGKRGLGEIFYGTERPVLADLIVDRAIEEIISDFYQNRYRRSASIPDAYEAEAHFPKLGKNGLWLFFTAAPLKNKEGQIVGAIETLQDFTAKRRAEDALMAAQLEVEATVALRTNQLNELNRQLTEDVAKREKAEQDLVNRNAELITVNEKLSVAQAYLVQSEKLASIGQLAAGVAHEINNPIGYIFSNFGMLESYLSSLFTMLDAYENALFGKTNSNNVDQLRMQRDQLEIDYLKKDVPELMSETREGIERVRKIVQDLKAFSHTDTQSDWQKSNINNAIDSTLNVVYNEVKYKANVVKDYGNVPLVECALSQINQVIMNLIVNAAQAIGPERGTITLRTRHVGEEVCIEVEDTGGGIPDNVLPRIFDPFYTTKPIGKGTGLGLSLSYGIVQKHQGSITVTTAVGRGSVFKVVLPVSQTGKEAVQGGKLLTHE